MSDEKSDDQSDSYYNGKMKSVIVQTGRTSNEGRRFAFKTKANVEAPKPKYEDEDFNGISSTQFNEDEDFNGISSTQFNNMTKKYDNI